MEHGEEILRKKIDDARFSLRLYEIYGRKMPSDKAASELCEKYRNLISALVKEYAEKYSEEGNKTEE